MSRLAALLHPIVPRWSRRNHQHPFALSAQWRDWLFERHSLTARLKTLHPNFRVKLLSEYYGKPTPLEQTELKLSATQGVWVREVILMLADKPVVYARTAIPFNSLTGDERRLQYLGERSLGSYLFKQSSLQRGQLKASRCIDNNLGLTWSRRSIFRVHGKPLMVSEAFTNALNDFL